MSKIGYFYQSQDDYLDVYVENGNDINEGKCTWLATEFLERANDEQKRLFFQSFAKDNPQDVGKIKQLYDDVDMPKLFQKFSEDIRKEIKINIGALPANAPQSFFHDVLESTIHK